LVRRAAGFIAYGSLAREYLVSLGAQPSRVEIGINTVDTEFFRSETNRLRASLTRGTDIKSLLCISYLTARKRIDQLLQVVDRLRRLRTDFRLVVLGDGPEKESLQHAAKRLGIESHIEFKGFVQKEGIPAYLAVTDCFLFPTDYDIWGLVLVEAMAAGVACVASREAGAVHDLIRDGETGFIVDFSDSESVAAKVNWILDNPVTARGLGKTAGRHIEKHVGLEQSAQGFTRAILNTLAG
jgi:glycosyltransferase involved in cell wall biosynthesis